MIFVNFNERIFTQEIKYITFGKEKVSSTRLGTAVYHSKVDPGTTGSWNDQLRVPSDAHLTDLGGCRIIRIKYVLKVSNPKQKYFEKENYLRVLCL